MSKRMFINMYNTAKKIGDNETMSFCSDILKIYEMHHIDDQIKWNK